jgi:putative transposase
MASYLKESYKVSIARACKVISLSRSMFYYTSVKDDSEVIAKLTELAEKRPREGQDKYHQRLRKQGYKWNIKRIRRVYLMLGLNLRRKHKRRIPARVKEPLHQSRRINQLWSMDFMSDSLMNGRRFRTFNVIDDYSRKVIALEAEYSFPSIGVIEVLKRAIEIQGKPLKVRVDNGPEFTSLEFTSWCKEQSIQIQFTQPGRPM